MKKDFRKNRTCVSGRASFTCDGRATEIQGAARSISPALTPQPYRKVGRRREHRGCVRTQTKGSRAAVNRADMLRECCFRRIGAVLVPLLCADADDGPANSASNYQQTLQDRIECAPVSRLGNAALGKARLGKAQIGKARLGKHPLSVRALSVRVLNTIVESHDVLRAIESQYLWFVPMLEVLTVPTSDRNVVRGQNGQTL